MVRWLLAAVGVFVLSMAISVAYRQWSDPPQRPWDAAASERRQQILEQYEEVSLVRLLAAPEAYDRRKVRVAGFVTLAFEDLGVHLDKTAYGAGLRKNAVWLERPRWLSKADERRLTLRYGEVAGVFRAEGRMDYGDLYSGSLVDIRRIAPTFTTQDFQQHRLRESRDAMLERVLSGGFLTLVGWSVLALVWLARRRPKAG